MRIKMFDFPKQKGWRYVLVISIDKKQNILLQIGQNLNVFNKRYFIDLKTIAFNFHVVMYINLKL